MTKWSELSVKFKLETVVEELLESHDGMKRTRTGPRRLSLTAMPELRASLLVYQKKYLG